MSRLRVTKKKQKEFLDKLRETCNVTQSALYCGVSRKVFYEHKAANPEFAAAWEEAIEEGVEILEAEARRRAFNGVSEPVFYLGKKCGAVQRYSDTLLIFLLKGHKPEKYRENSKVELSGQVDHSTVPVVNITIKPSSVEAPSDDASS